MVHGCMVTTCDSSVYAQLAIVSQTIQIRFPSYLQTNMIDSTSSARGMPPPNESYLNSRFHEGRAKKEIYGRARVRWPTRTQCVRCAYEYIIRENHWETQIDSRRLSSQRIKSILVHSVNLGGCCCGWSVLWSLQLEHAPNLLSPTHVSNFVVHFVVRMQCVVGIKSMRQPPDGSADGQQKVMETHVEHDKTAIDTLFWPVHAPANNKSLLSTISESNCENQRKLKCAANRPSLSLIRNRLMRNVTNIYIYHTQTTSFLM